MPANNISDLLPIPSDVSRPHAYQVFGLEEGEQDRSKIEEAVERTILGLKAAKNNTDAKLWGTAARLVQDARITLADPDKKAELDARFGIISFEAENDVGSADQNARPTSTDPLAGVLPPSDPLAAVLPSSNPMAPIEQAPIEPSAPQSPLHPNTLPAQPATPAQPLPPTGPAASPAQTTPESPSSVTPVGPFNTPQQATGPTVAGDETPVVVKAPKKMRRRKRSMTGTLVVVTLAAGMLGLICMLGYFLFYGPGQLAITKTGDQISISTQQPAAKAERPPVVPPRRVEKKPSRPVDRVMGDLAGDVLPPTRPAKPSGLPTIDFDQPGQPSTPVEEPAGPERQSDVSPDTVEPPPMEPPPTTSDQPVPEMEPPSPEPLPQEPLSEEMIAAADQALDRVSDLIRQANWVEMKPAAEELTEMRMSDEQSARAEGLYQLADLATYYRGGIERAVADLKVGNDFAITDTFRVIVVDKGEDFLTVRYNRKNKRFSFDEFPLSLANTLATFAVPDSATGQAAKAAYQAIAPTSNDGYRDDSVGLLREISGEVEGADPSLVADVIESLFAEDG